MTPRQILVRLDMQEWVRRAKLAELAQVMRIATQGDDKAMKKLTRALTE